jgi:hypothetical protein
VSGEGVGPTVLYALTGLAVLGVTAGAPAIARLSRRHAGAAGAVASAAVAGGGPDGDGPQRHAGSVRLPGRLSRLPVQRVVVMPTWHHIDGSDPSPSGADAIDDDDADDDAPASAPIDAPTGTAGDDDRR